MSENILYKAIIYKLRLQLQIFQLGYATTLHFTHDLTLHLLRINIPKPLMWSFLHHLFYTILYHCKWMPDTDYINIHSAIDLGDRSIWVDNNYNSALSLWLISRISLDLLVETSINLYIIQAFIPRNINILALRKHVKTLYTPSPDMTIFNKCNVICRPNDLGIRHGISYVLEWVVGSIINSDWSQSYRPLISMCIFTLHKHVKMMSLWDFVGFPQNYVLFKWATIGDL